MINLYCQTDWIANACTIFAGLCSAFVAWIVWRQQKKLQREQIRFERAAQVARLKNILCDIQQHSDLFLSNAVSSIRFIGIRTKETIYREYAQRYDLLNNLRNELIRENRFATILATSQKISRLQERPRCHDPAAAPILVQPLHHRDARRPCHDSEGLRRKPPTTQP